MRQRARARVSNDESSFAREPESAAYSVFTSMRIESEGVQTPVLRTAGNTRWELRQCVSSPCFFATKIQRGSMFSPHQAAVTGYGTLIGVVSQSSSGHQRIEWRTTTWSSLYNGAR
jgi:hypothetical protein